jgi:hypothetical protein
MVALVGRYFPGEISQTVNRDQSLILILRAGTFLCLLGWTWTHFYWEGPYAILVWNEATQSLAQRLGVSWEEFVGSGADDGLVQRWLRWLAWLYLAATVFALTVRRKSTFQRIPLLLSMVLLGVLFYAKYLGAQRQLPMLIEHGGQFLMPLLLVLALKMGPRHPFVCNLAIIAVTLTFAGHGAYALGLWPTPANFYAMTTVILGWDEAAITVFLRVVGALDFLLCIGLLIPQLRIPSALYAFAWGLATAVARPWAGMSSELNFWGADQYLHEALLRAPHFFIPLYLAACWYEPRRKSTGDLASEPQSMAES